MTTGKSSLLWYINHSMAAENKKKLLSERFEYKYLTEKNNNKSLYDEPSKGFKPVLVDKEHLICPECGDYLVLDFFEKEKQAYFMFSVWGSYLGSNRLSYECLDCRYSKKMEDD
jgi:hypothetical protein